MNNMTMQILAEKSGISKGYISMLEKGINPQTKKTLTPSLDKVQKIAIVFGVDLATLLQGTDDAISLPELSQPEILTIYNQLNDKRKEISLNFAKNQLKQQEEQSNVVQADFSIKEDSSVYSLEQYRNKIKQEWRGYVSASTGEFLFNKQVEYVEFDENEVPDCADFCLTVNGNSMEPIFKDGSYIFIEEKKEIPSGTIGVVIIDGEAFIKRVWFEGSQARLESFNKAYKDIIVTRNNSFKIIGKVVM